MSEIINRLKGGESRIENGIFFADDTTVLLKGTPETGFVSASRTTVSKLAEEDADGWVSAEDEVVLAESEDWTASSCYGAWEGEGFLVLRSKADGGFQWIMHLERAEQFKSAKFDGEILIAESGAYPDEWGWRICVKRPWEIEVRRREAAYL